MSTNAEPGADLALAELPPPHPLLLLQEAIQRGLDPDKLGKLVDLAQRIDERNAQKAYFAAMTRAQEKMPVVVKDKGNSQTGSKYADFATILHTCKPVWTGEGFSLTFGEADGAPNGWKRTTCHVMHDEGHSELEYIDLPLDGFGAKGNPIGQMNPVQAAVSTGSYAQRALVCRIFNITIAGTDLDGNSTTTSGGLTVAQVKEISVLLQEIGKRDPNYARRFWEWLEECCKEPLACNLEKVPAKAFRPIMEALERAKDKLNGGSK